MSGDYSRWSFDPWSHFSGVLMQQGRVQTDADWNEWVATISRRVQADSLDTLGRATVPRETADGFLITASGGAFTIGRGRIYVDGLLAENHGGAPLLWDPQLAELRGSEPTPYDAQPFYPDPQPLPEGGPHLVYLKVWQRELTHIEEPKLVENALGVDTTTRLQTAWQVKLLSEVGSEVTCATALEDIPGFTEAEPVAAGRLSTDTADVAGEPDPCLVPPSGGYKGLENQLYRVEIHRGGNFTAADRATFKWSRDNAAVASRVTAIPALDRIVVESVGRDALLRFSDGDWIEVTDDWRELAGLSGEMRRIRTGVGVEDATRTILLAAPLPAGLFPVDAQGRTDPSRNTRVRRWDQSGRVLDAAGDLVVDLEASGSDGTIPVRSGATSLLLESGVVVTFDLEPSDGRFRAGDHWLFAARTADASVEILDRAPLRGIHAHYAKLALVTFPDAETDCRTLWPPETAEGGCDCSVCVTPETHAGGTLTIQAAIEQVKQSGGTVCLGTGTYALREPIRIQDARSLRVRGQGWKTVLVAAGGGEAIDVRAGIGVRIENLAIVASTGQAADVVVLRNCIGVNVENCVIFNLTLGDGGGAAVGLDGYLIGAAVERCALVAQTGVSGRRDGDGYLLTASLRLADNWLFCAQTGIELGRFSLHLADTRVTDNTIRGCRNAGVLAIGGSVPTGSFNVSGNQLEVAGPGIVIGVDTARVSENDVHSTGERGDGIVLTRGLDPGGIDHCQLLGNQIRGVPGHGIAIRTRVNSGMIKHNIIADTGGGGIVMEGDGQAGVLVVENNQLLDIAGAANVAGAHAVALRFVSVRELDVATNSVHGFARESRQTESRAAISAIATGAARIGGNRLTGIAPPAGFAGASVAIEIMPPFGTVTIVENAVQRRGAESDQLALAPWIGFHVRGPDDNVIRNRAGWFPFGDVAVAVTPERTFVLTSTNAFATAVGIPGDFAAKGNEVVAESSAAAPIVVSRARSCQLNDNRITTEGGRAPPTQLRCARAMVTSNDFRGPGDLDVLHVDLLGKGQASILGNLRTGNILVNGKPLVEPWALLNPINQD